MLKLIRLHAASYLYAATAAPNGGQTGAFEQAGIWRQCGKAAELAMAWPAVRAAGLRREQLVAVLLLVTNHAATGGVMYETPATRSTLRCKTPHEQRAPDPGSAAVSSGPRTTSRSKVWWTLRGNVDVQRRRRRDAVMLRCTTDDEAVWTAWYVRLYKAVSVPRPQGAEPLLLLVVARFSGQYVDALLGQPASLGLRRPAQVVRIGAPGEALHAAPLSELDGPIRLLPCFSGGHGAEPDGEEAVLVLPRAAGHADAMPQ
jgi:hypothetical protein